jgi:RNA-binding protein Nova
VSLKLLLSNAASGLIIGRSGGTISDLQAKSLSRIKLSQGGGYFPGTSDRVCLIQGSLQNASVGVEMVLAKLYELQSLQHLSPTPLMANAKSSLPDESASTSFNVRLLIPSTCCGMIIGHGGSNIKTLKEKSEVTFIQLSPKEYDATIGERIMTITGPNFSSCASCVQLILNDMALNPDISRYINMTTNYSKKLATVSSSSADAYSSGFFPEHESFQHQVVRQSQLLESRPRYGVSDHHLIPGQFVSSSPQADQSVDLLSYQLLQQQGSPAIYDPFAHGGVPLPLLGDPSTIIQSQSYGESVMSSPPEMIDFGTLSSSFPQYPAPVCHPMRYWPPYYSSTPKSNIPSSASENLLPVDQLGQNFSTQALAGEVTFVLGMPDNKIRSITGHGGKTLSELEALSHTKIQIQGEYIPSTQNRIVTITGTERDIEHAKHLVSQCLIGAFSRSNSSSELSHLKDV